VRHFLRLYVVFKSWFLAVAVIALTAAPATAQKISIQYVDGDFKVTGWTVPIPDPEGVFSVYVGTGNIPPLLGSYSAGRGLLVFHPRFPLAPGVHYRAVFQLPGESPAVAFFDGPPQDTTPSTRVEQIYPSTNVLPANELKLYVYFSAPMSRGEAWQHIRLLDETGKPVPLAFLELDQELWDPDNQRLTVLFDPGRIKRGLVPEQEIGPPLVEGKKFMIAVDRDWHDARGISLVEGFEKVFSVGPADRVSPDPKQWKIMAPKAGTSDALVVDFPKPMDYALLQRLLSVQRVAGDIAVDHEETQWRFTPHEVWKAGSYSLVADATLEDLAGNHLDRAFDVDLQAAHFEDEESTRVSTKTITLPFEIR
jgi:hypothetical protein